MSDTLVIPALLASGATLQVEARRLPDHPPGLPLEKSVAGGPPLDDPERAVADFGLPTLEGALRGVESLASDIAAMLDRVSPDKASVEFDVELAVAAGQLTALLVKGGGKANFKIILSWEKSPAGGAS